jgi:hypothetical protein
MSAPHEAIRGRIGELAEELVSQLLTAGLSEQGAEYAQRVLESQLADDRLRPLIEAKLGEPAQKTLERLVLTYDPNSRWVTLACKN